MVLSYENCQYQAKMCCQMNAKRNKESSCKEMGSLMSRSVIHKCGVGMLAQPSISYRFHRSMEAFIQVKHALSLRRPESLLNFATSTNDSKIDSIRGNKMEMKMKMEVEIERQRRRCKWDRPD